MQFNDYYYEKYDIAYDIGSSLRNEYARYLISQWFDEAKKKRSFDLEAKDLEKMINMIKIKFKLTDDDVEDIADELKEIAQEVMSTAQKI